MKFTEQIEAEMASGNFIKHPRVAEQFEANILMREMIVGRGDTSNKGK